MSFSALAALAAKQHGLMTHEQAITHGLSRTKLSRLVRSGVWQQVRPRVFRRAAATQTDEQALKAVCLWHGEGAVVSHRSAARLHGLILDKSDPELTVPLKASIQIPDVTLHRRKPLDPDDVKELRGLSVTKGARTLIDLASCLDEETLAIVVEEAWRKRIAAPDWVARRLKELKPLPQGGRVLSEILADCSTRKTPLESALEVRVWRLMLELGSPRPIPNYEFTDAWGQPGRIDFAFPEQSLAIECDGYEHHGVREAFDDDRLRTARLVALGWRVMPITWKHVTEQRTKVLARIKEALAFRVTQPGSATTARRPPPK
ncbi:MAG: type IV toxin-antitoxin system AbiEi family antitoxin domain-containing protein [Archangium sp.]|nr:type IV toxin-antitoxin system AbiEi family antitoxin domain-containing protein [Archangium sp.]MDP3152326.1 type IV toxin-antitoxin system AbiEi family antitoxin domain-containing protein [Archangium sp.]MDP3570723.1 type IV toxin-antitoxin system AbiEi family antitoxin domain-containing protein [Archangium sp.]